jgi:hypothetical protein
VEQLPSPTVTVTPAAAAAADAASSDDTAAAVAAEGSETAKIETPKAETPKVETVMRAAPNSPPDAFAALAEESDAVADSTTSSASDGASTPVDPAADATAVDKQSEQAGKTAAIL